MCYHGLMQTRKLSRDQQTSIRRLLKLADFLDGVPEKNFDYGSWGDFEDPAVPECQTSGCALGWATQMRAFKRLGLRIDSRGQISKIHTSESSDVQLGPARSAVSVFKLDSHGIDEDVRLYGDCPLFELIFFPQCSYEHIRSPPLGVGPKRVARHIRRVVRELISR